MLAWSYISLQEVPLACMQFMSLYAVPSFVWAAHKNFAVLVFFWRLSFVFNGALWMWRSKTCCHVCSKSLLTFYYLREGHLVCLHVTLRPPENHNREIWALWRDIINNKKICILFIDSKVTGVWCKTLSLRPSDDVDQRPSHSLPSLVMLAHPSSDLESVSSLPEIFTPAFGFTSHLCIVLVVIRDHFVSNLNDRHRHCLVSF